MSSQEVNSSASTPQNSIITSTTEEDESQNNNNNNSDHVDEETESRPDEGTVQICSTSTTQQEAENSSTANNQTKTVITAAVPVAVTADTAESEDVQVVRSESVIKSPSKPLFVTSSTTPVIKVVDSSSSTSSTSTTSLSHGPPSSEANAADYSSSSSSSNSSSNHQAGETKRVSAIGTSVIAQTGPSHSSSSASPSQQQQNSTSFLHSVSSPTPSNPFLRTSSFSSSISSSTQENSSDLSSADIFAPPKLLAPFSSASGNLFSDASANFLRPSVLRSADSNTEGNLFSETISSSKTFISLNKEDIGTIKTPAFVKNTLDNEASSFSNGSSLALSKETDDTTVTTNDEKPLFTFGQNLSARVVFDSGTSSTTSKAAELKTVNSEINSTSDNLFSFSDNYDKLKDTPVDGNQSDESSRRENDAENRNGESSDGVFKRKYEVITGEEDEQNVLSIHGKLYAWDTDSTNWTEKGRGFLRLNDVRKNDKLCSRLVMRTTGALRVILNAHLVAGMKFELANDNCLRFTNVDGIYMIKANPKDIEHLNQAIEHRLREMSKRMKTDHEAQPTDSKDDQQQQQQPQQESKEESAFDNV